MPKRTITLTVETVEERRVPPKNNKLGNMLVFDERVTNINGIAGLKGRHSGFCVRVRRKGKEIWLCEAGWRLPGISNTPFKQGGQIHARGLLDFSSSTGTVAITGGTDDYLDASGQLQFNGQDYLFTVVTPGGIARRVTAASSSPCEHHYRHAHRNQANAEEYGLDPGKSLSIESQESSCDGRRGHRAGGRPRRGGRCGAG